LIESITLSNEFDGSILIDKTNSSYVLDIADFGVIESSHKTSKYYNQIGDTLVSSMLNDRAISISGWVIGASEEEIKNKKKLLNRMINPLKDIVITCGNYKIKMRPRNTIKYSVNYTENNEVLCKFLIYGVSYNPLFEDVTESSFAIATNTIVMNNGTIDTGFKIVLSSTGAVKNPMISLGNGKFILLNKVLANGESIVINTGYSLESIVGKIGTVNFNYYKYFNYDSMWLKLDIGSNTLSISAEENGSMLSALISYSNKYLEVQ